MFLHLVADYGKNDLAFNEVITHLKLSHPHVDVFPISVPPFSTIATGFVIGQLSLQAAEGMGIYANTAPRKDERQARLRNAGESFVYARLKNGVPIMAVNSGYSLSFVKKEIAALHRVKISNEGSQFRSRDNFPEPVISIMRGEVNHIGAAVNPDTIPDPPEKCVVWIDGYGNIKTSIRLSSIKYKPGDAVKITLNTTTHQATFAPGTFEVHEGELAFAPGSSGGDDRFMELFLRGGNAYKAFNKARVGQEIAHEKYINGKNE
ncbi:hypothetical protein AUK40_02835 [Candidatus Wirthbacteria bacterium CG2_30_54_11]|uniref:S-adenosyl-l-methionine hydroxide adenosyltransferase C-terminal domain-containing protein n=1 Tax=Candidatus Wirthbacteria bacterium CG2_30_54_11 TaxID=1817892 RepID=A0A1J5IK97_9BACT|nr:MAG: hypothetical protein AUK40_02835 [Candidatus Wirthbacteria bacterium CG2_30_54_11]